MFLFCPYPHPQSFMVVFRQLKKLFCDLWSWLKVNEDLKHKMECRPFHNLTKVLCMYA